MASLFDLKELYRDALYDLFAGSNREKWKNSNYKIHPFVTQVGSNFKNSKSKILFVGKSTNGWQGPVPFDITNLKSSIDNYIDNNAFNGNNSDRLCCRDDQMEWVENYWDQPILNGNKPCNTPFWQVVHETSVLAEERTYRWSSCIAWSELYKFAPPSSKKLGTPTESQRRIQKKHCWSILDKEVETIEPKNIVFFTSNWEKDYLDHLGLSEKDFNESTKFLIYPLKKAIWNNGNNDTTIILAEHPQGSTGTIEQKAKAIIELLDRL